MKILRYIKSFWDRPKVTELPLWLKLFSSKTTDVSRIADAVKRGPTIFLLNGHPVEAKVIGGKVVIKKIKNHRWVL